MENRFCKVDCTSERRLHYFMPFVGKRTVHLRRFRAERRVHRAVAQFDPKTELFAPDVKLKIDGFLLNVRASFQRIDRGNDCRHGFAHGGHRGRSIERQR